MWQDDERAKSVTKPWRATFTQTAKEYCLNLVYAGYSDWYLPSIAELESLVDTKRYDPAIKEVFKNTASNNYWSSSLGVSNFKHAWYVSFKNGFSRSYNKTDEYYVRCARARQ